MLLLDRLFYAHSSQIGLIYLRRRALSEVTTLLAKAGQCNCIWCIEPFPSNNFLSIIWSSGNIVVYMFTAAAVLACGALRVIYCRWCYWCPHILRLIAHVTDDVHRVTLARIMTGNLYAGVYYVLVLYKANSRALYRGACTDSLYISRHIPRILVKLAELKRVVYILRFALPVNSTLVDPATAGFSRQGAPLSSTSTGCALFTTGSYGLILCKFGTL